MVQNCYCNAEIPFSECCELYLNKVRKAPTAEKLMRSRFSAYALQNIDYLINTTHNSTRKYHKKADILDWSKSNQWIKLEIISSSETIVEFKAYYLDSKLIAKIHHERSYFKFENNSWFYVDGDFY